MAIKRTTRRQAITAMTAMAGLSVLPGGAAQTHGRASKAPNIIFILADDLGYADVSCYGRTEYRTPAIDSLAEHGLRFMQAYANSAVCSATRTGLITGRYQNRLRIGLEEPLALADVGLPPEHPTLPSLLRKAGYSTALIGKWHLGQLPKYGPLQSGYDHFWGFRSGGVDYFNHTFAGRADLWDDDRKVEQPGYLTDLLGDQAIRTIDSFQAKQRPFFISLHFNAPHWPWEGANDAAEAQRLANNKNPFALFDYDGGSQKTFADMVTRMDFQIQRVLDHLAALGLSDDTIVIFTSDNGGERYSKTWPFTGKKTELLEGGLRIPAIIRWPKHVPAGRSSEQVMISMDWLPTLVAAAGGATDPAYPPDGMDLNDTLRGSDAVRSRTLCWRYLNLAQEACRDGDWKYLKILDNRFLFNVVDDPQERANLKDRYPERFAALVAKYRSWDSQMLPLDPAASTAGFSGGDLADHFGITKNRTTE